MIKREHICSFLLMICSLSWADSKTRIAVNDLSPKGIDKQTAEILSDRLRAELVNTRAIRVMERSEMVSILKEQGFQSSGACDDASCLVEVGQLLGVENIIAGSIGKISDLFSVSLRVISVTTGEILFTVSDDREGSIKEVLTEVIPAAAIKISRSLSANDSTLPLSGSGETVSSKTVNRTSMHTVKPNAAGIIRNKDNYTLAYFDFDHGGSDFSDRTGTHKAIMHGAGSAEGYKGKGVACSEGSFVSLGFLVPDKTPEGTVELFIKPSNAFNPEGTYSIFGNQGARLHIIYKNRQMYFQKNHDNKHIFIHGPAALESDEWYKIAVSWGPRGMRLFINENLIGFKQDTSDYRLDQRDLREYGEFHAGYKNWCCMDGIGIYNRSGNYYFEGTIDELHISSVDRHRAR